MAWNGAGNFQRTNGSYSGATVWQDDQNAGYSITASRVDTHDQDIAQGINNCLAKDGQNAATANLNIGNYRLTSVGSATARADAAPAAQVQDGSFTYLGTTGGTSTAFTASLTPAITSYATGQRFTLKAHTANGASATIAINGLAAKTIQRQGYPLTGNEFIANDIIDIQYDGTNFQILNITDAPLFTDRTNSRIGISTTAPTNPLTVFGQVSDTDGTGTDQGQVFVGDSDNATSGLMFGYRYQGAVTEYGRIQCRGGTNLVIQGGGGRVCINTATVRNSGIQSLDFSAAAGAGGYGTNDTSSTNAAVFHGFLTGGTYRGGITNNNNTAVAYNTTSDYRLKNNVESMSGGLDKVKLLRPRTWKWKENGLDGQGFIAHELQEIIPDAVTGQKDAVDDEGQPKYQGVDLSFLVATLTNAIQELNEKVETLTLRIEALEA